MFEDIGRRAGMALQHARLYHQAQMANRLKDEFVAIVSHELRTPLTPILGGAYMLRSDRSEGAFKLALELIERNAKAQARIIDDLLDVSCMTSGKLRLNMDTVDLARVIRMAGETVRPAGDAKGIRIELKLEGAGASVVGDADRLQQVVWNLLANAVKFTPEGGVVTVGLSESKTHAEIRVSDTGIGIDSQFLPYVFDRFRQANTSRTRIHGGLGLGLAIVRHLVESHGGTVHASSSGGEKGATFVVRLPLRAAGDLGEKAMSRGV
jgi:signal transduction histidine kinase